MDVKRLLRHLLIPDWLALRPFPGAVLADVERAVQGSERMHDAELRFVVEGDLDVWPLLRGQTPRERAMEVFSLLRVWDTENNSGVLIYLQMVDRRIEIVADRWIARHVPQEDWDRICRTMESEFRSGRYREGSLEAIECVTRLLARYFPAGDANVDELPDKPVVL